MLAERAPRLATLDESLDRLEALSADATQLRSTLRELANARTTDIAPETVATLNGSRSASTTDSDRCTRRCSRCARMSTR